MDQNKIECSQCKTKRSMTAKLRKSRIEKHGSIEAFAKTYVCKECKVKKEVKPKAEPVKEEVVPGEF